jgi:hypothetical protein
MNTKTTTEFFDRVGANSNGTECVVQVCRRIVYGDPRGTVVTTDPALPHEECDRCGRMAVLCMGCSVLREDDACVAYEPRCRFKQVVERPTLSSYSGNGGTARPANV